MRLRLTAAFAAILLPTQLGAQAQASPDTTRLEEIVVSASRHRSSVRFLGVSADAISADELAARGLSRLEQALSLIPGTGLVRTGTPGGVASGFMRGTNSNHTLLLIDGIRVSDANLLPGSLLGGFELASGDRVEVVRGPQSTLYGGAAIGGVIAVHQDRQSAPRGLTSSLTAGSFSTYRGQIGGRWNTGRLDLAADVSFADTENERPFNPYDQRTESVRLRHATTDRLTLAVSFRGLQQSYTSPGDLRTSNTTPVGRTTFDHQLATATAEYRITPRWTSRLVTGWQHYFLRGTSRFNGGDEFVSRLAARRWVADWQHRVTPGGPLAVAFGVNAEWTAVENGDDDRDERLRAGYVEVEARPAANVRLSAGLRADDYSTFRSAVTGRVALAWLVVPSTKLRASVGTGFLPPSLSDRYGSAFQNPNPTIQPERSTGWDLGADWYAPGGDASVGVTVFENRLRDLIGFESAAFPDLGRSINVSRARTRGLEVSGRATLDRLDLRAGYALVSAKSLDETDPSLARLIRRPRHTVSADLLWRLTDRLSAGAGVTAALDREDSDFNQFPSPRIDPGDYADVRVSGRFALTTDLGARLAIENLFDHRYEEVYGFPALGRRLLVGLAVGR
ncbi:MAG: TonB-dependent receptor plug domain-containing protein [Gemmatimonadales bacterium]